MTKKVKVKVNKAARRQWKVKDMLRNVECTSPLADVCTVREASEATGLHPKSILMAILRGYLNARKTSDGIYLITTASVQSHWPEKFIVNMSEIEREGVLEPENDPSHEDLPVVP